MNKFFSKVNATHKKNQQHTSLNFKSQYNNQKKVDFFKCTANTSIGTSIYKQWGLFGVIY